MKRLSILILIILGIIYTSGAEEAGHPAPRLNPTTWFNSQAVDITEPGQVSIVEIWTTWCPHCVDSIYGISQIQDWFSDYITVVAVTNEDNKVVSDFLENHKNLDYPVAIDVGAYEQYMGLEGISGIPHAFVIVDGTIQWHGHPSDGLKYEVYRAVSKIDATCRLVEAAARGDIAEVRSALNDGADPNRKVIISYGAETGIINARPLIHFPGNIVSGGEDELTGFRSALIYGHPKVMLEIIKSGGRGDPGDMLETSILVEDLNELKSMITSRSSVDDKQRALQFVIEHSVYIQFEPVAEYLVSIGADINAKLPRGTLALEYARLIDAKEMVAWLKSKGAATQPGEDGPLALSEYRELLGEWIYTAGISEKNLLAREIIKDDGTWEFYNTLTDTEPQLIYTYEVVDYDPQTATYYVIMSITRYQQVKCLVRVRDNKREWFSLVLNPEDFPEKIDPSQHNYTITYRREQESEPFNRMVGTWLTDLPGRQTKTVYHRDGSGELYFHSSDKVPSNYFTYRIYWTHPETGVFYLLVHYKSYQWFLFTCKLSPEATRLESTTYGQNIPLFPPDPDPMSPFYTESRK